MSFELQSARQLAADVISRCVLPGDRVIDATMGNGHDTEFLARLVGPSGRVYAFDIQQRALEQTHIRLNNASLLDRCSLYLKSHSEIQSTVSERVRAAMFNLGWLPGGPKDVTTLWPSTKAAILSCMDLLLPGGVITVCVYPGHAAGDEERSNLMEFLSVLRPQEFTVLHQKFINAGPGAPECFVLQKNTQGHV